MNNQDIRKWCHEEMRASADSPMYARARAILALVNAADAPPWLADAAEALGEVRPEDGAPLALNWTQVIDAIHDLRDDRDHWKTRAEAAEPRKVGEGMLTISDMATEFFEGEWHVPAADGPEPWAVITYTDEPSPETGHVGWCWWAMGSMGDAPSYEAARDAAVAEIQRRMDRRMAVL